MKVSHSSWFLVFSFLFIILMSGCHPSPRDLTVVSGKTIYGNLALEDVHIEIFSREQARWTYVSDTRSGYHGSFRVHLPPGEYRITARKTIRIGQGEVLVTGTLEDLKIGKPGGRIDQVVILLVPVSAP